VTSLIRRLQGQPEQRYTFDDLFQELQYGGLSYPFIQGGTPSGNREDIDHNFEGYVNGAYKSNGVVFACMVARMLLFAEATFQFRRRVNGRPGDLFGTADLALLENPWPGATTGDLLSRAIQDADIAGNFYATRRVTAGASRIVRLRPDWVTIVTGSRTGSEIDTELVGYLYHPGGYAEGEDPIRLLPENVAHFAPIPDPVAKFRGMSWLSPVLEEVLADKSATLHKRKFFDNGAKLSYVVTLSPDVVKTTEQFGKWVEKFKVGHEGDPLKAYKTLFLGAGADVKTVGADLKSIDFSGVQGHGETRICAAARVPPIIVGLSEGLDSATYSNYGQARRAFADLTMRPMWRNVAGSFASLVPVPGGAELWYDDRDIPFLQEDQQDAATIAQTRAQTIRTLIEAGYLPDSARDAVLSDDFSLLKHSNLFSVQLQAPGSTKDPLGIGPSGTVDPAAADSPLAPAGTNGSTGS
jgi:phage portal protein BeeE